MPTGNNRKAFLALSSFTSYILIPEMLPAFSKPPAVKDSNGPAFQLLADKGCVLRPGRNVVLGKCPFLFRIKEGKVCFRSFPHLWHIQAEDLPRVGRDQLDDLLQRHAILQGFVDQPECCLEADNAKA